MKNFFNSFNETEINPSDLRSPATAMYVLDCAANIANHFRGQMTSDAADDIPMDVYTKLLSTTMVFSKEKGAFKSMIENIARRRAIDILRHVSIDHHVTCDTEAKDSDGCTTLSLSDSRKLTEFSTPEDVVINDEEMDYLEQFIDELPDRAQIIVRAKFEGESSAEIADRLGMTVSAVDTAYSRAYKQLASHREEFFMAA